mmetsp:Transcript_29309/g.47048  ORF Transcript_29309/g.47048 Transcript_29309/m.47048 type:complete len:301 (-) Transcript_29309:1179-2081(-)
MDHIKQKLHSLSKPLCSSSGPHENIDVQGCSRHISCKAPRNVSFSAASSSSVSARSILKFFSIFFSMFGSVALRVAESELLLLESLLLSDTLVELLPARCSPETVDDAGRVGVRSLLLLLTLGKAETEVAPMCAKLFWLAASLRDARSGPTPFCARSFSLFPSAFRTRAANLPPRRPPAPLPRMLRLPRVECEAEEAISWPPLMLLVVAVAAAPPAFPSETLLRAKMLVPKLERDVRIVVMPILPVLPPLPLLPLPLAAAAFSACLKAFKASSHCLPLVYALIRAVVVMCVGRREASVAK